MEKEEIGESIKNDNVEKSKCIFCNWETQDVVFTDEKTVVFNDKYPMAKIHILVIPKEHIDNINSLNEDHLELLNQMKTNALNHIKKINPEINENEIIFGFHTPPFNSINHLHMHCIVPPFKNYYYYFVNTYLMMTKLDTLIDDIKNKRYHWAIENLIFGNKNKSTILKKLK